MLLGPVKQRTNLSFLDVSVLEQKIEQEEETNKSSADLRIRKTQVSLISHQLYTATNMNNQPKDSFVHKGVKIFYMIFNIVEICQLSLPSL